VDAKPEKQLPVLLKMDESAGGLGVMPVIFCNRDFALLFSGTWH
jgi:hypothetical protein